MQNLVSVIIPIYNVEKYLEKCLQSVASQTYTNIQVILINDGSPDNCNAICEAYCKKDNRFSLVCKKNGGPSSARNVGLNLIKGDYLLCVDADDWIEPNMIEVLLQNMISYKADLSVCSFYEDKKNCTKKEFFSHTIQELSQEDAIKELILPKKFYGFLWNKLLKKDIIANLRFDESIIKGEDSLFLCQYILNCNSIVLYDIPLYHYRIDSVSISRSKFNEKKMSVLEAYSRIVKELDNHNYPKEIVDMQKVRYASQLLSLRTNIICSGKNHFLSQLEYIDLQMKEFELLYLKSRHTDFRHKIAYFLGTRFKTLFNFFCRITKY